jgi:hypothetical protein
VARAFDSNNLLKILSASSFIREDDALDSFRKLEVHVVDNRHYASSLRPIDVNSILRNGLERKHFYTSGGTFKTGSTTTPVHTFTTQNFNEVIKSISQIRQGRSDNALIVTHNEIPVWRLDEEGNYPQKMTTQSLLQVTRNAGGKITSFDKMYPLYGG